MDWLLYLGLKEGLVECATLCVKSEVILSKDVNLVQPIWSYKCILFQETRKDGVASFKFRCPKSPDYLLEY